MGVGGQHTESLQPPEQITFNTFLLLCKSNLGGIIIIFLVHPLDLNQIVKIDFSFKGFVQIQQNISHMNEHSHFTTKQLSPAAQAQSYHLQGAPPKGRPKASQDLFLVPAISALSLFILNPLLKLRNISSPGSGDTDHTPSALRKFRTITNFLPNEFIQWRLCVLGWYPCRIQGLVRNTY